MEQFGYITSVLKDNKCKVLVQKLSGCGSSCSSCSGCGHDSDKVHIVIDNRLNCQKGDYVKIEADSKLVLKYSILLYGLPLFFFILGIIITSSFMKNIAGAEIISFFVGLLFMIFSFMIIKFVDKKYAHIGVKALYMSKKLSKKDIYK